MTVPRHQQATLATHTDPATGALGYVLGGVPYGVMEMMGTLSVQQLARAHAAALDIVQLETAADNAGAKQAAALAFALSQLATGQGVGPDEQATLHQAQPASGSAVHIRTDGSADKTTGAMSVAYLLNNQPYATTLPTGAAHEGPVHEGIAERAAIYAALRHAGLLGFTEYHVQSDHKFHTRRYAEDLIHRRRRKSESLERLDALVDELQPHIHFEYAATLDTDAPHRLAMHARALSKLAQQWPLTRAEKVALRRVHFALREGGDVLF